MVELYCPVCEQTCDIQEGEQICEVAIAMCLNKECSNYDKVVFKGEKMGYLKNRYLEGIQKETEVTLQEYQRDKKEYTKEEQKKIDDMIDCQIEDAKIKRDEKEIELGGKGILG